MLVDAFIYIGPSLLNQFFCDSAIIDKTLFYEIKTSVRTYFHFLNYYNVVFSILLTITINFSSRIE